jgi:hypothetical protein
MISDTGKLSVRDLLSLILYLRRLLFSQAPEKYYLDVYTMSESSNMESESSNTESESCSVFVSGSVEHVQLLALFVAIKNKEVNLTAVVWPIHYYKK